MSARPPLPPRDPAWDPSINHYWKYHGLAALLACKRPVTDSADEDLFIAVHQICEVSFHQMILDLARVSAAWAAALAGEGPLGDLDEAVYFLRRVVRMYDVVNTTVPVLGPLRAFSEFRAALGPSSGFQSAQFRHLEILAGVGRRYWSGGTRDADGNLHPAELEFERVFGAEVERWLEDTRGRSLVDLFEATVARAPGEDPPARLRSLAGDGAVGPLLVALGDFEEAQRAFHRIHLGVAVAQLARVGVESGTGGTTFKEYLTRYEREVYPLFRGLSDVGVRGGEGRT